MRKFFVLLFIINTTAYLFAQAPQKMSYQAVIRNSSNVLVVNQNVGLKISILDNNLPVYVETQTPTTNANGLITTEIGGGVVVSGSFSSLNWSTKTYTLKTEIDPTGGTNYTITSTSQFLSVPYALNSKSADTLTGTQGSKLNNIAQSDWNATSGFAQILNKPVIPTATIINSGNNIKITGIGTTTNPYIISTKDTLYLGQEYLGGIIFYLYNDSIGKQHGLVVSKTEASCVWSAIAQPTGFTGSNRLEDGSYNTNKMISIGSPAYNWINTNYGINNGWYLPSINELQLLINNSYIVNKISRLLGYTLLTANNYWSSTETSSTTYNYAFSYSLSGSNANYPKTTSYSVRAIKSF